MTPSPPLSERRRLSGGRPDIFYAQLAADYASLVAMGSRRPVVDLAKARGLASNAVRDAIYAARRMGFLTESPIGQPGGQTTTLTKGLLKAATRTRSRHPKADPS